MSSGEPKYCPYCTTFYSVKRSGDQGSKYLGWAGREDTDTFRESEGSPCLV